MKITKATKSATKSAKQVKTLTPFQRLSDSDKRTIRQYAAHKAHTHKTFQSERETSERKTIAQTLAAFVRNASKPARAYIAEYLA